VISGELGTEAGSERGAGFVCFLETIGDNQPCTNSAMVTTDTPISISPSYISDIKRRGEIERQLKGLGANWTTLPGN
jgi:hypothetical protein